MRFLALIFFLLLFSTSMAQKKKLEPPQFSQPAGFYKDKVEISLSENIPDATLYYTLDGSEPTTQSQEYIDPIQLDSTVVLKVKAFKKDYTPSKTSTSTYIINEHFPYAVVSLSLDPQDLWDEKKGMYVEGPKANSKHPHYGANYWKEWEKPGHVEFWDTNAVLGFSQNIGVRIFGGWSRTFPQKSFKLYAKEKYGESYMNYKIFPEKPIKKYKRIVLRNGGSDCDGSHFRDEFMIGALKNTGIDMQDYRPAIVFLNGQYWGIYFIREKIDEYFIEQNHQVDKDSIDMVEKNNIPKCGTLKNYNAFLDYLKKNDLSDSLHFAHVKTLMDIDNYVKFSAAQVYFQNRDAGGNTRCWRSIEEGSKWRWIMYDVDLGYGRFNNEAYKENSLKFCTDPKGPSWPNPPWSTFLLRKMFESDEFKTAFINQMCDNLNSVFSSDSAIYRIDLFRDLLEPEMERHQKRWGWTMERWKQHMNTMKEFAKHRPSYMRAQMLDFFDLEDTLRITINASKGGKVKINSITVRNFPWQGIYFNYIPIQFTAIPNSNYRFAGWQGAQENAISFTTSFISDSSITALFEPIPLSTMYDSVIFNEIGFHISKQEDAGDWVELVNLSKKDVDLSGWVFKDGKDEHEFYLPAKLILKPGQYIVLCNNLENFEQKFPEVINVIGNFSFGLNSEKETLRLFDKNGNFVDSLSYNTLLIPQNAFITEISLVDPFVANHNMANWMVNAQTPGTINEALLTKIKANETKKKIAEEKWNRYRLYATIASIILLLVGLLLYFNEKRKKKMVLK